MSGERFDEYMERCLYGDTGFYSTGRGAGRGGRDFITSPEVGPLFGAVIARAVDALWDDLDRPDEFAIVEAAAGRGALAAAIFRATPRCGAALRYVTVERSDELRAAQLGLLGESVESVADLSDLPELPPLGLVLANELLDNLPFRMVEHDGGGWCEVYVEDGRPQLRALEPVPFDIPEGVAGERLPVCEQANRWITEACSVFERGMVLAIDYGVESAIELLDRQWLRTYRDHVVGADPFEGGGSFDLTTDVPFDQLPEPARLVRQREFLTQHGLGELVEEGKRIWTERAHLGDLEAIAARSRVTEAEALVDESGLGDFFVAEWVIG